MFDAALLDRGSFLCRGSPPPPPPKVGRLAMLPLFPQKSMPGLLEHCVSCWTILCGVEPKWKLRVSEHVRLSRRLNHACGAKATGPWRKIIRLKSFLQRLVIDLLRVYLPAAWRPRPTLSSWFRGKPHLPAAKWIFQHADSFGLRRSGGQA